MAPRGRTPLSELNPGQIFGRLTVIREDGRTSRKERTFLCRCECGQETVVRASNLRRGNSTSCGCRQREQREQLIHRGRTHGCSPTATNRSWSSLRQRCTNPRNPQYARYGGRGITVCERWGCFENFLADMGERPPGTSIDRIDVNGHYEPGNCRWATTTEQARNTRRTFEAHEPEQIRWLVGSGYTQCEVARFFDVDLSTVHRIIAGRSWA